MIEWKKITSKIPLHGEHIIYIYDEVAGVGETSRDDLNWLYVCDFERGTIYELESGDHFAYFNYPKEEHRKKLGDQEEV
jgi:hypothetical protein